jgi:hypothetical protein
MLALPAPNPSAQAVERHLISVSLAIMQQDEEMQAPHKA